MMFPRKNINWADNAVDILSASEEECEQACLDDRACMAILFENNQCKKQPLPLRYMKRITGSSVKAFIKTAGQNSSAGINARKEVAVKKLEKVIEEGERAFQTEMNVIGKTHHKNLVRLFGYCDEGSHRLLVYEFMSNGSLASLLYKTESPLDWI
ncbi:hypothetical protein AMTR_s00074p00192330 [Amborella trichopoda]|uniref:Protein kinase domain-containing protein n=1 Tax=Amborella trichopoda TaxID=13333 RepID=W1NN51_AMBTC|nr:hypothetical protein AMTR_s00074p00192330 [Amborella trichopoda]